MPKKIPSTAKVKARTKRQLEFANRKSFGRKGDKPNIQNLVVSMPQLAGIVRATECTLRDSRAKRLRDDLEASFAQYAVERHAAIRSITPRELQKDLKEIEEWANGLAIMLVELREAQDAMVRAVRPQYDVPMLVCEPIAPPYFTGIAIEIAQAAAAARKSTSPKPYVRAERGQTALNNLIEALLDAWERAFEPAPTVGHTPHPSAFIKFVCACFKHMGLPVGELEALAKKCQRIQKARRATRR